MTEETVRAAMETVMARTVKPKSGVSQKVISLKLTLRDTKKVCCFLGLYPNGIESMSMDSPGLVQTSCNLGIFKVNGSGLEGSGSVRSSIASRKQLLLRRIGLLAEGLDGTLCVSGEYPAWEYRRESHLRDVMCKVYESQYGKAPKDAVTAYSVSGAGGGATTTSGAAGCS